MARITIARSRIARAADAQPTLSTSFIVPSFDSGATLERCLNSIRSSAPDDSEIIVVDDGSLDGSAAIADRLADVVLRRPCQGGAARCRNDGAAIARGSTLIFVDSDVEVLPGAVEGALVRIEQGADAVFGSYTALCPPAVRNRVTDYKNLLHHFTHLCGAGVTSTFWSGFGAVRRSAFSAVDGFDPSSTTGADVEDIHLGYRLSQAGFEIFLDPELQVMHHKRYTLRGLLRSDVLHRAIPWTRAMLQLRTFRSDLNLRRSSMLMALLSYTIALVALLAVIAPSASYLVPALGFLTAGWIWANRRFLRYARRSLDVRGTFVCAVLLFAYFLYGPVGAVLGGILHLLRPAHRSILNRLSLGTDERTDPVQVTVAAIVSPGEIPEVFEGLPEPQPWWELVVVAEAEPSRLPAQARFISAPPASSRNSKRNIALQASSGTMLATIDGHCIPDPGWLDAVRHAASRGDLVVGGSFREPQGSLSASAYYLSRLWEWRCGRPAGWLPDHPINNAAFRSDVARALGGFSPGGALMLRFAAFGARPVRFDPAMSVYPTAAGGRRPLTVSLAGNGRVRAAATSRYFDIGLPLRLTLGLLAPFSVVVRFGRMTRTALRARFSDLRFWLALPVAFVGYASYGLGRGLGFLRPGRMGGVVPRSTEEILAMSEELPATGTA